MISDCLLFGFFMLAIADASNDFYNYLFKIVAPVFAAISISLAVKSKTQKLTIKRAFISTITALGITFFIYPFVKSGELHGAVGNWEGVVIGAVAILSEKLVEFMLYKFDVDVLLGAVLDHTREYFMNLLKIKK